MRELEWEMKKRSASSASVVACWESGQLGTVGWKDAAVLALWSAKNVKLDKIRVSVSTKPADAKTHIF